MQRLVRLLRGNPSFSIPSYIKLIRGVREILNTGTTNLRSPCICANTATAHVQWSAAVFNSRDELQSSETMLVTRHHLQLRPCPIRWPARIDETQIRTRRSRDGSRRGFSWLAVVSAFLLGLKSAGQLAKTRTQHDRCRCVPYLPIVFFFNCCCLVPFKNKRYQPHRNSGFIFPPLFLFLKTSQDDREDGRAFRDSWKKMQSSLCTKNDDYAQHGETIGVLRSHCFLIRKHKRGT
jgi:hypothetical protein